MVSNRQQSAAKRNIKKAQAAWQSLTPRQRATRQPQGRLRAGVGTTGDGDYYRIIVRPKTQFTTFRYHDVGDKGHIQRLSGRRSSGSWSTQAWLVSKSDAHVSEASLIADSTDAKKLLSSLGSTPKHVRGDIFEAKDRPNVPEKKQTHSRPTKSQIIQHTQSHSRNVAYRGR